MVYVQYIYPSKVYLEMSVHCATPHPQLMSQFRQELGNKGHNYTQTNIHSFIRLHRVGVGGSQHAHKKAKPSKMMRCTYISRYLHVNHRKKTG